MNKKEIQEQLINFHCPSWDELLDISIYMDQVIAWITQQLSPLYFQDEKILTRSMVNNYVKNTILEPPLKKQYNRKHLAYLIVVCILKRCYALSEIATLIEVHSFSTVGYRKAYDKFANYFEIYLHEIVKKGHTHDLSFDFSSPEEKILCDVIDCIVNKIYSELFILSIQDKI